MEARVRPRQSFDCRRKGKRLVMLELNPSKTRPSALQHGAWAETAILPGEDPRQFERLHRGLIKEWSPCGPAEQDAVLTLAKCMWRKHRIRNLGAPSLPAWFWLMKELALEERLDRMIDRALRRLGQMKAMKEVMAFKRNAAQTLAPRTRPDRRIEGPSIEPAG